MCPIIINSIFLKKIVLCFDAGLMLLLLKIQEILNGSQIDFENK